MTSSGSEEPYCMKWVVRPGKIEDGGWNLETCKVLFRRMVWNRGLLEYLDGTARPPGPISRKWKNATAERIAKHNSDLAKFRSGNAQVIGLIHAMVNESVIKEIRTLENAKEVWDAVCRWYESKLAAYQKELWKKLEGMKLPASEAHPLGVYDYFNNMERIRYLLERSGCPVEDDVLISLVMRSMPECFHNFNVAFRSAFVLEGNGMEAKTFMNAIQDYATVLDRRSQYRWDGGCSHCRRFGHLTKDCRKEEGD